MSWNLQPPSVVASLPRPLDKKNGRVHAAPCFALRESRRKKRHEVVVATDGEGVNLYNIQHQTLVASYPLPSQLYHKCAPTSIIVKSDDSPRSLRHTLAIVQESGRDKKCKILVFSQNLDQDKTAQAQRSGIAKKERPLQRSDILAVEAITNRTNGFDIAVYYKSGHVELLASDLAETRLLRGPVTSTDEQMLFATVATPESAVKGLLKERSDVAATGHFLCQVIQQQSVRSFRLVAMPDRIGSSTLDELPPLLEHTLNRSSSDSDSDVAFELHVSSGRLYELSQGQIQVYDLTGLLPRTLCKLSAPSVSFTSFSRLSTNLVLALSASEGVVFESTFGTIKATTQLHITEDTSETKKRKQPHDQTSRFDKVVTSFPQLDLVVVLTANELVTLQTEFPTAWNKRARSDATLLVDVLGNGSKISAHPHLKSQAGQDSSTDQWVVDLDSHVAKGDVEALETFIADTFHVKLGKGEGGKRQPSVWDPDSLKPVNFQQWKVIKCLQSIFQYNGSDEGSSSPSLSLKLPVKNILAWLATAGFLDTAYLKEAISSTEARMQPEISSIDSITSIYESLDGFEILWSVLSSPAQLQLDQVAAVLKCVVRSLDIPSTDEFLQLQETQEAQVSADGPAQISSNDERTLEVASQTAEAELQKALGALSSGLEIRCEILRLTFARLLTFPSKAVSRAIRTAMTQSEILFFILILRSELISGGWTSLYIYDDFETQDSTAGAKDAILKDEDTAIPLDQAIEAIGTLLNCAIDAIGISGWLVGQSGSVGTEQLIDSLLAEVTAVIQGCFDAKSLGIALKDLEKYEYQKKESDRLLRAAAKKRKWRDGEVTRYEVETDPVLPLGSKVELTSLYSKDDKRNLTLLENARNRMVGNYEIDKIRV